MSDLVEIGAKGAYAENDWWRSVAHDDDGKGRYQEMNGVRMRAVEWHELDADDRDSRLKEARAALTAIEKAGHRISLAWQPIETAPKEECAPFLVLLPKNDVAPFVVLQVCWFEGRMYPDARDACIDWEGGITTATHWMPTPAVARAE